MKNLMQHIRKCNKKQVRYDWLGFVENQELAEDVRELFTFYSPSGYCGFDWVNGNNKLKEIIALVKNGGINAKLQTTTS